MRPDAKLSSFGKKDFTMPAYAIGLLRDVQINDAIARYIREIDATLEPFGGAFKVHGGKPDVLEGELDSTPIIIEFPDMARAQQWYASPAYQALIPLRTRNSEGVVFLVDGVGEGYRGAAMLGKLGLV
jgi:uncharacterized protein (DUF1330 family)